MAIGMVSENISSCGTRGLVRRLRRTMMASWSMVMGRSDSVVAETFMSGLRWWRGGRTRCRGWGDDVGDRHLGAGEAGDQCRGGGRVGQRERDLDTLVAHRRGGVGTCRQFVDVDGGDGGPHELAADKGLE